MKFVWVGFGVFFKYLWEIELIVKINIVIDGGDRYLGSV